LNTALCTLNDVTPIAQVRHVHTLDLHFMFWCF
jgi:hypothetical protein